MTVCSQKTARRYLPFISVHFCLLFIVNERSFLMNLNFKKMTKYIEAKQQLKAVANNLKRDYASDKPAIREGINNGADAICKEYYFNLSEYQQELLHNYACKLHP